MRNRFRFFVWLLCVSGIAAWMHAPAQRLPEGVRPEHYGLTLTPDLAMATFRGDETIDVILEAPSRAITLNAAEIHFDSVTVATAAAVPTAEQSATITLDPANEQATFHFAEPLPAGKATLHIGYSGVLSDKLRGFYLSRSQPNVKDRTPGRRYAVTQFEPTDARRAFPSFDEPALKATFDIALVLDDADMGLSNMDAVSDHPGPVAGKHTVRFRTTPRMSTYLVAFLAGEFKCAKGAADGVPIRVCASLEKAKLTKFALEAAEHMVRYDDAYFGIKYPLPKLDLIALPDFEAGAMENFGALTFRETELLAEPGGRRTKGARGQDGGRKEVALTVAHEISHQWFGDLVTMGWWDDLWLNEGFATWMESKSVAAWHPEWGLAEDNAEALDGIMSEDAQRSTRAIRVAVSTPDEINQLFDGIAYQKSGAVLGMVEQWLGEDTFRDGVRRYLAAHLYGTATAEDFWNAEAQISAKPVDAVMRSFVDLPGVPLLSFSEADVSQQRFIASGGIFDPGQWTIPACVRTAPASPCPMLSPGSPATLTAATGFLSGNAGDKGYYRSEYTAELRRQVIARAESALSPTERVGLFGDQWALMRAGRLGVDQFLDLVLALREDPSPAVLETSIGEIEAIEEEIATDADRARLQAVIRRQFAPLYASLTDSPSGAPHDGTKDSRDRQQLRGLLFEALGRAGDEAVLAQARAITATLLANGTGRKARKEDARLDRDPAIIDASVVLTTQHGDAALYDRMQAAAERAVEPGVATEALHVLTTFEDPALVDRTLQYAVSGKVRNQDSGALLAGLLAQRDTRDQTWRFLNQHWDAVHAQLTVSSGSLLVAAAGDFCTAARHDEVAQFFRAHPVEAADRALAEALERIDGCVAVRQNQQPALQHWLDLHS